MLVAFGALFREVRVPYPSLFGQRLGRRPQADVARGKPARLTADQDTNFWPPGITLDPANREPEPRDAG